MASTFQKIYNFLFGSEIITPGLNSVSRDLPNTPMESDISKVEKNLGSQVGIAVIDLSSGTQMEFKPNAKTLRAFAGNSTWIRAALEYKREKIGRAQFELIPVDSTTNPKRVDKFVRSEIEKVLNRPNEAEDSYGTLKEQLLEDYYVIGHGCFELDLFNDTTVRGINILDAARLGFNKKWDGKTPGVYRYALFHEKNSNKVERYFANEQIFCLVNRKRSHTKLGLSHIEVLFNIVRALLAGDERLIKQIIQPVSEKLISLGEGVTPKQVEEFKYQLNQVKDKLAVLGNTKDPKVLDLSGSPEQMKILDSCEWFVRQVAAVFNMSTAKLKLSVDTSRANTATMFDDDLEGLEGDLNRIIELENKILIDRYKYLGEINLKFSYPILHRKDETTQARIANIQTKNAWASTNEARTRTGEKTLDSKWADEILVLEKGELLPWSILEKRWEKMEKEIENPSEPTEEISSSENSDTSGQNGETSSQQ